MNFKIIKNSILILLILPLLGCNKNYENIVLKYLNHIKNNQFEKAYKLLSKNDKIYITKKEFINNNNDQLSYIVYKFMTFKIIESGISKTGNSCNVQVQIKEPDLYKILIKIPELSDKNLKKNEIQKIINKNKYIINNNYIEKIINYKLILENKKWYINADYEKIKKLQEMQLQAKYFYENNNYDEALKIYKNIYGIKNDISLLDKINLISGKINYINKFIKLNYKIKNNKIFITINNAGNLMISSLNINLIFLNNQIILKKEIINIKKDNNEKIGHNETINKSININITEQYNNLECLVCSFEY